MPRAEREVAERMAEKMPLTSEDICYERIARLRDTFPEAFTEGKVDFDKLRQVLGEKVVTDRERYGLSWARKSEAIRNIQTPSVATLVPNREESVEFDTTENLFVEGDNLEVLKLLQKGYHGQVKMIYIDPPYNTGNEFIYPDNFREGIEDYLRYSGQVGDNGTKLSTNTETGGRYHSNWLSMMYPRLFLARNLLREDGVIFVSIDDHEIHNLRMLMNEIFGEEHFVAQITWKKRGGPPNDKVIGAVHEYIVIYARSADEAALKLMLRSEESKARYGNPDGDPRGAWVAGDLSANAKGGRFVASLYYEIENPKMGQKHLPPEGACWRFSKERMQELMEDNRITFGSNGTGRPKLKRFLTEVREGVTVPTLWDSVASNTDARREINEIFGSNSTFETPKPTALMKRMLEIVEGEEAIILDFFAGSAATAQSVLEQNNEDGGNRRFIMVQLPEKTDNPDYPTIADIGKVRIRRVIEKLNDEDNGKLRTEDVPPQDRGFKVFELTSSNFKIWDGTEASKEPEQLVEQLRAFSENVLPDRTQEDILYEILLKSGLPLTAEVEQLEVAGREVYAVSGGLLFVCLEDHVDEDLVQAVAEFEPGRFVCLDSAFDGNDKLKTNTVLKMKDCGIEFRTV